MLLDIHLKDHLLIKHHTMRIGYLDRSYIINQENLDNSNGMILILYFLNWYLLFISLVLSNIMLKMLLKRKKRKKLSGVRNIFLVIFDRGILLISLFRKHFSLRRLLLIELWFLLLKGRILGLLLCKLLYVLEVWVLNVSTWWIRLRLRR